MSRPDRSGPGQTIVIIMIFISCIIIIRGGTQRTPSKPWTKRLVKISKNTNVDETNRAKMLNFWTKFRNFLNSSLNKSYFERDFTAKPKFSWNFNYYRHNSHFCLSKMAKIVTLQKRRLFVCEFFKRRRKRNEQNDV